MILNLRPRSGVPMSHNRRLFLKPSHPQTVEIAVGIHFEHFLRVYANGSPRFGIEWHHYAAFGGEHIYEVYVVLGGHRVWQAAYFHFYGVIVDGSNHRHMLFGVGTPLRGCSLSIIAACNSSILVIFALIGNISA